MVAGPAAFARLRAEGKDPTLEWVTPGHPLFEAVREKVWERVQNDLRRGVVFHDLGRTDPARLRRLHRRRAGEHPAVEVRSTGETRLRQPIPPQ